MIQETTFVVRGRQYRLHESPRSGWARVTGQVRSQAGSLLPKIVPLLARALREHGYATSPMPHYYEVGPEYVDFAESPSVAYEMLQKDLKPILQADLICQQCHADAATIQRRAALATLCGLAYTDRVFFREMRKINDRFTARLGQIWDAFEHPQKHVCARLDRAFVMPINAYRRDDDLRDPEPQEGDREWIQALYDQSARWIEKVFAEAA